MTGLYIAIGIALLIALILFVRSNVIINYEENLTVFLRILFIKIRLIPAKQKKHKKRRKKVKKHSAANSSNATPTQPEKKENILQKLWAIKSVLLHTIEKFLGKLHFKFVKLNIVVAGENATSTALLYGAATQGVTYLIEILDNISNVDISKKSDISVRSDFVSQKSSFEGKIVLYISTVHIIYVGVHFLKKLIKSKFKMEE